ncbi:hypothetical protein PMAYCL1PPCAC_05378, partial [Pristionchus mayeri]
PAARASPCSPSTVRPTALPTIPPPTVILSRFIDSCTRSMPFQEQTKPAAECPQWGLLAKDLSLHFTLSLAHEIGERARRIKR